MSHEALDIARTIQAQLPSAAFRMMGASNLVALDSTADRAGGLTWKLGRGAVNQTTGKAVTHLTIELTHLDVYTVRAIWCRGATVTEREIVADVYAENLADVVESLTGFYLTIAPRR